MAAGGPWTFYLTYKKRPTNAGNSDLQTQPGPIQGIYTIADEHPNFNLRNDALQQLLHEKDEEIVQLKENCSQLRTRNDAQQQQLHEKDEKIVQLKENCSQLRTRNDAQQQQLHEKDEEIVHLKENCSQLRTRNDALQQLLHEKQEEIVQLKENCNQLQTRLSEIGAMQLTAGNPNITDLSDPDRPEKLVEQFSELYDNQWTDCFQTIVDCLGKTEEQAVQILLTILKTAYDITLDRSQNITKAAKDALEALVGKSHEEPEKARDTLIKETLHKLQSYRTKNFRPAPKDIAMAIEEKLLETIGEQLITTCGIYIEQCVRICWLMCIKDPPMYIFCEKEDTFDKNRFVEYTEKGHAVSYVVWPVLYLYHNGPLMKKGVAQGVGKRKPDRSEAAGSYMLKMMPR